jgi:hypothetical protein
MEFDSSLVDGCRIFGLAYRLKRQCGNHHVIFTDMTLQVSSHKNHHVIFTDMTLQVSSHKASH